MPGRGGRSGRRSCVPGLTLMALLILSLGISASETDFDRRRANLVSELRSELAQLAPRLEQGRVNEAVLDAIGPGNPSLWRILCLLYFL